MKTAQENAVRELLTQQKSPEQARALYDRYLADDCVWENTGFPPAQGRAQINALLDALFAGGYYSLDQTIVHILSLDNVVMAERYERMLRKDGSVIVEFKIVGVFEFGGDGLIHAFRDFFDASIAAKAFAG